MPLEEYKRKRNFKVTSEPPPGRAKPHKRPIFVIQEHHATRLHFDFRLECDGVLKSWAVTNMPTLDPSIKRLAVEVEDHPIAYASFSGDIPEGQYGAGHVEIWDSGTYRNLSDGGGEEIDAAGLENGKLEFELHGEKLKGAFALIRMKREGKRNNWLLIKKRDEFAGTSAREEKGSVAGRNVSRRRSAGTNSKASDDTKRASRSGRAPGEIEITNPDKIMFPDKGYTKGDVIEFYERISPLLLPHLKDRPVTIERLPDGLGEGKPRFWQKNTPKHYPSWIPRIELQSEDGGSVTYTLVNNLQTLLYLVNQGALTFHVWMSRVGSLDRPDYVLFDLDPGERTFADAVRVAKKLHTILDGEKVEAAVKTSGKSGLHLLVKWTQSGGYDEARDWALEIAGRLVDEMPDVATIERSKAKRGGRLYVDVMQNARGHHAVAPYVLRAVPEATVSTPLEWKQVTARLTPKRFDIRSVFKVLEKREGDLLKV